MTFPGEQESPQRREPVSRTSYGITERSSKLYVIASSHPCATAEAALRLKGMPYRVVELPPELHRVHQRLRFRRPTVPSMVLDGQKLIGSRAIVHRVDELVPDPPLLPEDPSRRAAVEGAERWGDEVLQNVARRIEIAAHLRRPEALPSYMEDSRLPSPPWLVRLTGPLVMRSAARFHGANEGAVRADLAALPAHLDHVDELIAASVIGGARPNAADLQLGSSLKVLSDLGDVHPLLEGRPALGLGERLFPELRGSSPAGALPASWLADVRPQL
jgi:glutathione S-transferase